jgi:hypothetical protein
VQADSDTVRERTEFVAVGRTERRSPYASARSAFSRTALAVQKPTSLMSRQDSEKSAYAASILTSVPDPKCHLHEREPSYERTNIMDTNTIIIIVVLILLFGGGGFYWRGRR